jgi:hypothetical protein
LESLWKFGSFGSFVSFGTLGRIFLRGISPRSILAQEVVRVHGGDESGDGEMKTVGENRNVIDSISDIHFCDFLRNEQKLVLLGPVVNYDND